MARCGASACDRGREMEVSMGKPLRWPPSREHRWRLWWASGGVAQVVQHLADDPWSAEYAAELHLLATSRARPCIQAQESLARASRTCRLTFLSARLPESGFLPATTGAAPTEGPGCPSGRTTAAPPMPGPITGASASGSSAPTVAAQARCGRRHLMGRPCAAAGWARSGA